MFQGKIGPNVFAHGVTFLVLLNVMRRDCVMYNYRRFVCCFFHSALFKQYGKLVRPKDFIPFRWPNRRWGWFYEINLTHVEKKDSNEK